MKQTSTTYIDLTLVQKKTERQDSISSGNDYIGTEFTSSSRIPDFGQYYSNFIEFSSGEHNTIIVPYFKHILNIVNTYYTIIIQILFKSVS